MNTLSGCTIVRNGVLLKYPLEASVLTYLPICDEVVILYDPTSDDQTEEMVQDIAKRYPQVIAIPSPWNMNNHTKGTEITIQSNIAIKNCSCDWVLYVQADEAIHESDHNAIKSIINQKDISAGLFDRRSFLYTLDREIPEYFARRLLRLFRNGKGYAVGDAMTCNLIQSTKGKIVDTGWRMFNYSRMGHREEILLRSSYRDNFYHDSQKAIEEMQKKELKQNMRYFDFREHPKAICEWYKKAGLHIQKNSIPSSITLIIHLTEKPKNFALFVWQFQNWPGDVVLINDCKIENIDLLQNIASQILEIPKEAIKFTNNPMPGDFSAAMHAGQNLAQANWVLHTQLNEHWNADIIRDFPNLITQLEHDGKDLCGFPRANFVNNTLINDTSANECEKMLASQMRWPPINRDIQYRLIRINKCDQTQSKAVALQKYWILHNIVHKKENHLHSKISFLQNSQMDDLDQGFSILIPTWNNIEYLRKCVESLQKYSSFPHQIILHVNEGNDGTLDFAKDMEFSYTNRNVGICLAMNMCGKLATKRYIMYFNDDMVALPGWDIELYEFCKKHSITKESWISSTMIEGFGNNEYCLADGEKFNYGRTVVDFQEHKLLSDLQHLRKIKPNMPGSTWPPNLMHIDMWQKIGGFSEEFSPGLGSDPDLAKKMWDIGCRTFIGVGRSLVYHFGSKTLHKIVKNDGEKTFYQKHGMTIQHFQHNVLKNT